MSDFSTPAGASSIVYVVGGTPQNSFVIPFPFDNEADVQIVNAAGTVLTWGVSGTQIDGFYTGATAVLDAAVANTTVRIYRSTAMSQGVVFARSAPFYVKPLNREISRLWLALQERFGDVTRSLRAPASDADPLPLPAVAARASRLLAFNASGDPVAASRSVAGQATMAISTALITVTHGFGSTPLLQNIRVTPLTSPTASGIGSFWVTGATSTVFEIRANTNVAGIALLFGWQIDPVR